MGVLTRVFSKAQPQEGNGYTPPLFSFVFAQSRVSHRMLLHTLYKFANQEEYQKNFHRHKHMIHKIIFNYVTIITLVL